MTDKEWDKGEHEGCGVDTQRAVEAQTRKALADRIERGLNAEVDRLDFFAPTLSNDQWKLIADALRRSPDGGETDRAMDLLGDVPGDTLCDRVERLISYHLGLQVQIEELKSAPVSVPAVVREVHAILFEPERSDAADNLDGALIDIIRLSQAGKPADSVCTATIERVVKQLERARAALSQPAPVEADRDELNRLREVGWAAQGLLNADTNVSSVPREQAISEATGRLRRALGTWQMHHCAAMAFPATEQK